MQDYPPRDAAYRNRLASYGENFINCAVNKENLALAGFSVSFYHCLPVKLCLLF